MSALTPPRPSAFGPTVYRTWFDVKHQDGTREVFTLYRGTSRAHAVQAFRDLSSMTSTHSSPFTSGTIAECGWEVLS